MHWTHADVAQVFPFSRGGVFVSSRQHATCQCHPVWESLDGSRPMGSRTETVLRPRPSDFDFRPSQKPISHSSRAPELLSPLVGARDGVRHEQTRAAAFAACLPVALIRVIWFVFFFFFFKFYNGSRDWGPSTRLARRTIISWKITRAPRGRSVVSVEESLL